MKTIEKKREEAEKRSKEYNSLTAKQRLIKLDLQFGEGLGARKERARLALKIVQETNSQGEATPGQGDQRPKKNYQKPKRS